MPQAKRILSVTVKRMVDDSPDTSWLGEYSDTRTSEFAIDRQHTAESSEFRYFNPGSVEEFDASASWLDGKEDKRAYWESTMRENARRDYERMESYNRDAWGFVGVSAEAEVQVAGSDVVQTITSGGLWGIESDAGAAYFGEVEAEQLSELRGELTAMRFSKRAISKAFQDVERSEVY